MQLHLHEHSYIRWLKLWGWLDKFRRDKRENYWWLVTVTLVVASGFLNPKIWEVTETYEWCFVIQWWGHPKTLHYAQEFVSTHSQWGCTNFGRERPCHLVKFPLPNVLLCLYHLWKHVTVCTYSSAQVKRLDPLSNQTKICQEKTKEKLIGKMAQIRLQGCHAPTKTKFPVFWLFS